MKCFCHSATKTEKYSDVWCFRMNGLKAVFLSLWLRLGVSEDFLYSADRLVCMILQLFAYRCFLIFSPSAYPGVPAPGTLQCKQRNSASLRDRYVCGPWAVDPLQSTSSPLTHQQLCIIANEEMDRY